MIDGYIGEMRMLPYNFSPKNWLPCDGRLLNIFENETLFVLLGTTYGGNGSTTFGLPDLRGRVPMGQGTDSQGWVWRLGQKAGEASVSLTPEQIPPHQHTMRVSSAPGAIPEPVGVPARFLGESPNGYAEAGSSQVQSTLTQAGGGQAHENRQPFSVVQWCICVMGVFPSRD